jgi:hypothetical protein
MSRVNYKFPKEFSSSRTVVRLRKQARVADECFISEQQQKNECKMRKDLQKLIHTRVGDSTRKSHANTKEFQEEVYLNKIHKCQTRNIRVLAVTVIKKCYKLQKKK